MNNATKNNMAGVAVAGLELIKTSELIRTLAELPIVQFREKGGNHEST